MQNKAALLFREKSQHFLVLMIVTNYNAFKVRIIFLYIGVSKNIFLSLGKNNQILFFSPLKRGFLECESTPYPHHAHKQLFNDRKIGNMG